MMPTTIIVSMHEGLSTAFIHTASRFVDVSEIIDIPLNGYDNLISYQQSIADVLKNKSNVLVLTDFLSGACTISFMKLLEEYSFSLVTGTNMTMLLDAIENKCDMDCFQLSDFICRTGTKEIKNCNKLLEGMYEKK